MADAATGGLADHLRDAIRLNRARRAGYVRVGGWWASALSHVLVGAERVLLPVARLLDRQAAPFWAAGIPVLRAELADMAGAPAAGRPVQGQVATDESPSWIGGARGNRSTGRRPLDLTHLLPNRSPVSPPRKRGSRAGKRNRARASWISAGAGTTGASVVRTMVGALSHQRDGGDSIGTASAQRALRADDFQACADALGALVRRVRQRERDGGRHYALTSHVVESAGLMALRGADYAEATDGATAPLTRRLVRGHLLLVPFARALDRAAGPVHDRGAGLFVNDLPPIPFEAELRAARHA